MNSKPAHYELLGGDEAIVARFASRATDDTISGRAEAITWANLILETVNAVYSESTGKHPRQGAWECSECGTVHLGRDAAEQCCTEEDPELLLQEQDDIEEELG